MGHIPKNKKKENLYLYSIDYMINHSENDGENK